MVRTCSTTAALCLTLQASGALRPPTTAARANERLPRRAVLAGAGAAAFLGQTAPASAVTATAVKRFSMYDPKITPLPPFGALSLLEDELFTPKGADSKRGVGVKVRFEFPSPWTQLDRALGGIVYVDGALGDKLCMPCAAAALASSRARAAPSSLPPSSLSLSLSLSLC